MSYLQDLDFLGADTSFCGSETSPEHVPGLRIAIWALLVGVWASFSTGVAEQGGGAGGVSGVEKIDFPTLLKI